MKVRIIGTESLGVRGLSCLVEVAGRKIFIDPGLSLGYMRHGLLPHPVQIGVGQIIKKKILEELADSTDLVLSHMHGDHIPLYDANPYQLPLSQISKISKNVKIWAARPDITNEKMNKRAEAIPLYLKVDLCEAKGQIDGTLEFIGPVPHGERESHLGRVVMTKIRDRKSTFLHASDIQFLDSDTVTRILELKPNMVIASGPPLYLEDYMQDKKKKAWDNMLSLAKGVETLIVDHHLLRSEKGLEWLEQLSDLSGNKVLCAADFMGCERHLLEAKRVKLYEDMPVAEGWHQKYTAHELTPEAYMELARKEYAWFQY